MASSEATFPADPVAGNQDANIALEENGVVWLAAVFDAPERSARDAAATLRRYVQDNRDEWYRWLEAAPAGQLRNLTAEIANRLNALVRAYGNQYKTTMVLSLYKSPWLTTISIGDSPAYILDRSATPPALLRICHANSYAGGIFVPDNLDPNAPPVRYLDFEYLGQQRRVEPSEVFELRIGAQGGLVLLASDGLEDYAGPLDIKPILLRATSPSEVTGQLCLRVNPSGEVPANTKDDVTMLTFDVQGERNAETMSSEEFSKKTEENKNILMRELDALIEAKAKKFIDEFIEEKEKYLGINEKIYAVTESFDEKISNSKAEIKEHFTQFVDNHKHYKDIQNTLQKLQKNIEDIKTNSDTEASSAKNTVAREELVTINSTLSRANVRLNELELLVKNFGIPVNKTVKVEDKSDGELDKDKSEAAEPAEQPSMEDVVSPAQAGRSENGSNKDETRKFAFRKYKLAVKFAALLGFIRSRIKFSVGSILLHFAIALILLLVLAAGLIVVYAVAGPDLQKRVNTFVLSVLPKHSQVKEEEAAPAPQDSSNTDPAVAAKSCDKLSQNGACGQSGDCPGFDTSTNLADNSIKFVQEKPVWVRRYSVRLLTVQGTEPSKIINMEQAWLPPANDRSAPAPSSEVEKCGSSQICKLQIIAWCTDDNDCNDAKNSIESFIINNSLDDKNKIDGGRVQNENMHYVNIGKYTTKRQGLGYVLRDLSSANLYITPRDGIGVREFQERYGQNFLEFRKNNADNLCIEK